MLCIETHTRIHLTPVFRKGNVIKVGNLDTVGIVISALQKKQNARNVVLWGHYAACCKTKRGRVKRERFDKKKGRGNRVDGDKWNSASDDSNSKEKSEFAF
jgi:hypothetical protein